MSSLTERRGEHLWFCHPDGRKYPYSCMNKGDVKYVMEKLEYYEKKKKQGRLIEPKCGIDSRVWVVGGYIKECTVKAIHIYSDRIEYYIIFECDLECAGCPFADWEYTHENEPFCSGEYDESVISDEDFGKTVFLTKEEAEVKLAELKGTEGHTLDYEHFEGKSKAFLNAIEIVKGNCSENPNSSKGGGSNEQTV